MIWLTLLYDYDREEAKLEITQLRGEKTSLQNQVAELTQIKRNLEAQVAYLYAESCTYLAKHCTQETPKWIKQRFEFNTNNNNNNNKNNNNQQVPIDNQECFELGLTLIEAGEGLTPPQSLISKISQQALKGVEDINDANEIEEDVKENIKPKIKNRQGNVNFIDCDDSVNFNNYVDLKEIYSRISEVEKWIATSNEINAITFNANQLLEQYARSVGLNKEQNNRVKKKFSKTVKESYGKRTRVCQNLVSLNKLFNDKKTEFEAIERELQSYGKNLQTIKNLIEAKQKEYFECKRFIETVILPKKRKFLIECNHIAFTKHMKQQLEQEKNKYFQIQTLLTKCKLFSSNVIQYLNGMLQRRDIRLNQFETNWANWNYDEIILWFQIKLDSFDNNGNPNVNGDMNIINQDLLNREEVKWGGDNNDMNINNYNRFENNDENKENQDNKQDENSNDKVDNNGDNLASRADFRMVRKKLEDLRYSGKFLSLLSQADLKNIGFKREKDRITLEYSILKLMQDYPLAHRRFVGVEPGAQEEKQNMNGAIGDGDGIDEKYKCPITQQVMIDPVIAYDGRTYERQAIIQHLNQNGRAPNFPANPGFTVEQTIDNLMPDFQIKDEIDCLQLVQDQQ